MAYKDLIYEEPELEAGEERLTQKEIEAMTGQNNINKKTTNPVPKTTIKPVKKKNSLTNNITFAQDKALIKKYEEDTTYETLLKNSNKYNRIILYDTITTEEYNKLRKLKKKIILSGNANIKNQL